MKKITSVLLLLCLLLLPVSVSAETVDQADYVTYELVGDAYVVKTCVKTYSGKLVIPAEHEGKPVTAIADTAFFGCQSLSAVEIAEGITSIGNQAFQGCTNLSEVKIPASVTSIGFDAFHNTAYYNDENNWEQGPLYTNTSDFLWDSGLLYIDGCLVAANPELAEAIIAEGTRLIAGDVFFGSGITAASLPASIEVVGARAFSGCANLTEVYYGGKQSAWGKVSIAADNNLLTTATIHYESVSPTQPPSAGKQQEQGMDPWLWVAIISGAVAVVTGTLSVIRHRKNAKTTEEE